MHPIPTWAFAFNLLLIGLLFLTALALVSVRHDSREWFIQLQALREQTDELDAEWGRLQLEYNTLADPARIERIASKTMNIPPPDAIRFIHQHSSRNGMIPH